MRETITISLSEDIKATLDQTVREQGLSRSEVIREALREYLLVRRFRQLRESMLPHAQEQDVFTDQNVFDRIS